MISPFTLLFSQNCPHIVDTTVTGTASYCRQFKHWKGALPSSQAHQGKQKHIQQYSSILYCVRNTNISLSKNLAKSYFGHLGVRTKWRFPLHESRVHLQCCAAGPPSHLWAFLHICISFGVPFSSSLMLGLGPRTC